MIDLGKNVNRVCNSETHISDIDLPECKKWYSLSTLFIFMSTVLKVKSNTIWTTQLG